MATIQNIVDVNGDPMTIENITINHHEPINSDEEIIQKLSDKTSEYKSSLKAEETKRKYTGQTVRFEEFLEGQQERRALKDIPKHVFEQYLSFYIMSFKRKDGGDYLVNAFNTNVSSLTNSLKTIGVETSTMKHFHEVVAAKRKELTGKGLGGTPNRAVLISWEMEDQFWNKNALGEHNPTVFLQTLYYVTTTVLGHRGSQEARLMYMEDIEIKIDNKGREYLEWTERTTKTRTGQVTRSTATETNNGSRGFKPRAYANLQNPMRDPVRLWKRYKELRAEAGITIPNVYITPNQQWIKSGNWFINVPWGANRIREIMKKVGEMAGILKNIKLVNHSTRRTYITRLYRAGVDPILIAQLSGHRNLGSLLSYTEASEEQQEMMCDIIQNRPSGMQDEPDVSLPDDLEAMAEHNKALPGTTPSPAQKRQAARSASISAPPQTPKMQAVASSSAASVTPQTPQRQRAIAPSSFPPQTPQRRAVPSSSIPPQTPQRRIAPFAVPKQPKRKSIAETITSSPEPPVNPPQPEPPVNPPQSPRMVNTSGPPQTPPSPTPLPLNLAENGNDTDEQVNLPVQVPVSVTVGTPVVNQPPVNHQHRHQMQALTSFLTNNVFNGEVHFHIHTNQ